VNQEHFTRFAGRVGLFNNQAGDRLLHLADLIICIGYSPVEYEPSMWNSGDATLVHIDVLPAYEERNYVPDLELVGDIAATLNKLASRIDHKLVLSQRPPKSWSTASISAICSTAAARAQPVCPASAAHRARHAGHRQQRRDAHRGHGQLPHLDRPLPLQLPRASGDDLQRSADHGRRAAVGDWRLAGESGRKVVSVSGDGGFLQSSMELETAVRLNANVLHIIWVDNGYNMVAIQEEKNTSAFPASSSARSISKSMPTPSARKALPWRAPRRLSRRCVRRWMSMARPWWPFPSTTAITRC
jgi:acetolactate synthase-1/2/3 large subunit